MKRISLLILVMMITGLMAKSYAQVDVTFQVDMSEVGEINPLGVHVAGSFQSEIGLAADWLPGGTELTEGEPGIYSITVQLPAGTYAFKYINGNDWGMDETVPAPCVVDNNRELIVGTDPVVLEAVCYASCTPCNFVTPMAEVTFQVNMAEQELSDDGVHITGSFQGWDPAATSMELAYDAVYSYTILLEEGSFYKYKFVNGTTWDEAENVPSGCNDGGDRFLTVPEDGIVLDPVCFASCVDCAAPEVELTFQVDMNNEEISPLGVHIAGSFQNPAWQPGDTPMTDAGNGIYTYSISLPIGEFIEYKFVNGNSWDDPQPEQVPGECASYDGNRFLTIPGEALVLDPVCFGVCGPCPQMDLLISEYVEGGSNNKYIEIYNPTGAAIDLSNYSVKLAGNGGDWGNTAELSGMLASEDVFVIANSSSAQVILDAADITSTVTFYNGDDALGLFNDEVLIDVIGIQGEDPGSYWPVAGVSNGTQNHTLVRKMDVCYPTTDWALSAGTDVDDSQWIVYPQDDFTYIGFHVSNCGGGNPIVATPLFSMPSGTYFGAFDVEISTDTPDATIYYTIDGSDPDNTSTEYMGPIAVAADVTIKAIAYADGFDASFVSTADYQIVEVTEVANLAELRSNLGNTNYFKVIGEVVLTYQQDYRGQKYIQDATAGVLIDDNSGNITTSYALYDGITGIIGTLNEYGGMIQFTPATDPGAATSAGNVIVPQVITINDMLTNFEEYEAELVQILGVTFANAGAVFSNGNVYPINDDSKAEGLFRTTFYDVDYIGEVIPPVAIDITGICNSRNDGEFISSRSGDLLIPDYLLLTTPNGGEQVEQGGDLNITWSGNAEGFTINIELINDDIPAVEVLAEGVPVEQGFYTWTANVPLGNQYKINIVSEDFQDVSDDYFSVVPPIDIKITEIMYNPPESGSDTLEFVEFYNNGAAAVNLLGWAMTKGADFVFPDHLLGVGEYVIVCESAAAFLNTFGLEVYEWSGSLSNGGEEIELSDNAGTVRAYVDFDDNWYPVTDGEGPSLTFCDPALDNTLPDNWSVSTKLAAVNGDGEGLYCTPLEGCNQEPVLPVWYNDGWSGISANVEPSKIMMEELFAPAYGNMVIMLSKTGIFWPGYNINTIGEWNTYEGYKTKFDGSTYFVYSGPEVENKLYTFDAGFAFVPVLSSEAVALADVILPLGETIELMYSLQTGEIYWPDGGIIPGVSGALETLIPGYAYLTKFTTSGQIDFGIKAAPATVKPHVAIQNTTSWNNVMRSQDQHIISLSATALDKLEAGDVIGVFNAQDLCVGMAAYTGNESVLPLVAYGDDMSTENVDGLLEGENLNFKVYRFGQEIELTAVYNKQIQNHDGLFAANGMSVISDLKAGATGIGNESASFGIYPNPGNGLFNIEVNGVYQLSVSNAHGQLVYSGQINGSGLIKLTNQPEGIYFIKLTGENTTHIEKVIIQ